MTNKFLTGLAAWSLFIILMGIFFPIPTINDVGSFVKVLHSYTIYGFFSITPIVVYGSLISFTADWLAKRINWHVQPLSFSFHMAGAACAYLVTQNVDIMIMAMLAAALFFLADRYFVMLRVSRYYIAKNVPIFLGFAGVTAMVVGSSMG
ncbi:hypothetical protein [Salibacterium aidingense]|uniref:hypothetical protein n=1 Tax=Salibacterium aidingense TaxID=384933 RepID=UPI00040EA430|nr:hypothetical protein [Salibacterium aidingense]